MPEQQNVTNIPSNRVELIDSRTGLMSREWYRFFLNLFNLAGGGGNQVSLDELQIGPPPQPVTEGGGGGTGTVTSVDVSGGTTGLTTSDGPITTSGTITMAGTLNVTNGGTGATTATDARTNLSAAQSGANADITSMSGITGAVGSPTSIQMGNGSGTTLAAGKMWYDQTNGSWNMGMGGGNITQQVGEEQFIYGKASAAITEGQLVCKTGTVGASGVITFGPSPTGLTVNDGIIGVATENIALNAFGRITQFGVVHGINTTGASVGETWADNDTLYYNPNYAGGMTNVKPTAPNIKFEIATVINAGSGGSGSIQVLLQPGSTLGGTDSNVQITTPSNGQILTYDGSATYWRNTSVSAGTGISVSAASNGVLTITNTSPSSGGTVTSVTGTSPVVSSGGTTPAISLASGYGDTQNPYASKTANYFLAAPNGSAGTPTFRAIVAADIPALSYVSSIGVTAPITTTGGLTPTIGITQASTSTNGYLSSTDWNTFNNKQAAGTYVTSIAVASSNGFAGSSSGGATPTITLTTSITGLLKGNGTAISAATAGTDYSAGTSALATGILKSTTTTGALSIAVAGDFPTLNQNTTGTASNVTGVVAITNGGTGQSTKTEGFDALAPTTTKGDLIVSNGTDNVRLAVGTDAYVLTADSTAAAGVKWAAAAGGSSNITAQGMWENANTISANYSITSGNNAVSAGPVTISSGVTVTIPSGSRWAIV